MRRQENQPPRPTAGCLSVPIFNQRNKNRLPLTSIPSENEFFSHSEYMLGDGSASYSNTSGTYGWHQTCGSCDPQIHQWGPQSNPQFYQPQHYSSDRPAPGPAPTVRAYAPVPHPYKAGNTSLKVGPQVSWSNQNIYEVPCSSDSVRSKRTPDIEFSDRGQLSPYRPANPTHQYSQQWKPVSPPKPHPSRPPAPATAPQNSWKFTNSFEPQTPPCQGKKRTNHTQNAPQTQPQQTQSKISRKPAVENSLRILTAVIDGMRHWSQFKDKVPYLFEIFATLDSAVTLGPHGSKSFLMRDGKEAVQCIFYENEQELPRLIRGQVHRCVGNYDRRRDVLMCVSVRPGLPSELRNAQEAVKACDVEMRAVVKLLNEV
ncbi:spermatogenesis-associated protein 22 [Thalassophryne amazonica]|uniref:spermatogenesis-associated protein 22 n=1 Tax=Thalassophryne amazonica TaxID=390379 RepID=UPI001470B339|nr:spermatogenesis-associated protein 22 [Thalassophryne amazonica]